MTNEPFILHRVDDSLLFQFRVFRQLTERSDDIEGQARLHEQRTELIQGLVQNLDLNIVQWPNPPREWVDVVVSIGDVAGELAAMFMAWQTWVHRQRVIMDVEFETPDGSRVHVRGTTPEELQDIRREMEHQFGGAPSDRPG